METITPIAIVNTEDLKSAINTAIKASLSELQTPHPILSHLLIKPSQNHLEIVSYNLETGIVANTPAKTFGHNAITTTSASTIQRWLSFFESPENITISKVIKEDDSEYISMSNLSGKSKIEYRTIPAENFPQMPDWSDAIATIEIDAKQLKPAIAKITKFCSQCSPSHPQIEGINILGKNGKLTIQSSNGHVISRFNLQYKNTPDFSAIFKAKKLNLPKSGMVKINIYPEYVSFETKDNGFQFTRQIPGNYPTILVDWEPQTTPLAKIDKKDLITNLRIATSSNQKTLTIDTSQRKLELMGESLKATIKGLVIEKMPVSIKVDANYFKDVVNAITGQNKITLSCCKWKAGKQTLTLLTATNGENLSYYIAEVLS